MQQTSVVLAQRRPFAVICGDHALAGAVGALNVDGHVDSGTFGTHVVDHWS
jgi:hypothetical protein